MMRMPLAARGDDKLGLLMPHSNSRRVSTISRLLKKDRMFHREKVRACADYWIRRNGLSLTTRTQSTKSSTRKMKVSFRSVRAISLCFSRENKILSKRRKTCTT